MVWNEALKRRIPYGWEVGSLNKIANITMGQSPSGTSYNETGEGLIFFQGSTDFGWRFPSVRQFTTSPSRFAKQGDILLSVRAPVGAMNIADVDCCIGRGLAALHSKIAHDVFLFNTVLGLKVTFERRNVDGTTFGSITKDDLHSLTIIIPPGKLQEQYESIVKSAHLLILKNHKENQHLSQLRDWLLPMLMNGQVIVE